MIEKLNYDDDLLLKESSQDTNRSYASVYGDGLNGEEFWEEI